SASAGVPIRLIALSQFDAPPQDAAAPLEPLIKSIRLHGIVQPLLVRKHHSRYEVIAGRRRFAAAAALGLTEGPCVLHPVDEAARAGLGAAENIRVAQSGSLRAAVGAQIAEAVARIADDVARLQTSIEALRTAPDGFERSVTADLLSAQAARTRWLANIAALLSSGRCRAGKRRPLASIVDDLVGQFDAECRLAGLRFDTTDAATSTAIDDGFVTVAIGSAVMMTLSL